MFYKCYSCKRDIENKNGEHYEVHFIIGKNEEHISEHGITLCKDCYRFIKVLLLKKKK